MKHNYQGQKNKRGSRRKDNKSQEPPQKNNLKSEKITMRLRKGGKRPSVTPSPLIKQAGKVQEENKDDLSPPIIGADDFEEGSGEVNG